MYTGEMFDRRRGRSRAGAGGHRLPTRATLRPAWQRRGRRPCSPRPRSPCRRGTWMQRGGGSRACTPSTWGTCCRHAVAAARLSGSAVVSGASRSRCEPRRRRRARRGAMLAALDRAGSGDSGALDRRPGHRARRRVAGQTRRWSRVTPTYSGCPATELIMRRHRPKRSAQPDSRRSRVEMQPRPGRGRPTGWRRKRGASCARSASRRRGTRARAGAGHRCHGASARCAARDDGRPCPRCGSARTRDCCRSSARRACKAQYRCDDCLEPFDYFKPH